MKIKVNYKELSKASDELKKDSEELKIEVDKLLSYLPLVKDAWKGQDSLIFVGKAEAYFKNIKQIAVSLDSFSSFIDLANKNYYESDKNWKDEIEKAGDKFGSNELKLRN